MINIEKYRVAIFDCDGVILNSNAIKSEAFGLALPDEDPVLVEKFIKYHQENGGISRYIKFEYFFKHIKMQTNYSLDLESALKRYATLSKKGLLECSEIPGVIKFLEFLNSAGIQCYVISGGDQLEVNEVLKKRGISLYFKEIFGSPLTKTENLKLISGGQVDLLPGVFFGDARSDMLAAKEFNLDFVYISGVSEWEDGIKYCNEMNFPFYSDFSAMMRY